MQDRRDWLEDDSPYDEGGGTGLLGSTIRNAAVILGVCLGVAWLISGSETANPGPSVAAGPQSGASGQPRIVSEDEPEDDEVQAQAVYSVGEAVTVPPGPRGHFLLNIGVNGTPVRFLVDTGATTVTLTEQDARRVGLIVHALDYSARFETANGPILAAPVTLRDMSVGGIEISDVDATVTQAPLNISLLGMSFLKRLSGYEVRSDGLVLHN